jgi:hypothetical protein
MVVPLLLWELLRKQNLVIQKKGRRQQQLCGMQLCTVKPMLILTKTLGTMVPAQQVGQEHLTAWKKDFVWRSCILKALNSKLGVKATPVECWLLQVLGRRNHCAYLSNPSNNQST